MTYKVDEAALCELTAGGDSPVAIAECIEGLGCTVYAGGAELSDPWASHTVEELVGIRLVNGAIIGTHTQAQYFIVKRNDEDSASFELVKGPLDADQLSTELAKVK